MPCWRWEGMSRGWETDVLGRGKKPAMGGHIAYPHPAVDVVTTPKFPYLDPTLLEFSDHCMSESLIRVQPSNNPHPLCSLISQSSRWVTPAVRANGEPVGCLTRHPVTRAPPR
eukprot:138022-Hanusia_phi.AAC.1